MPKTLYICYFGIREPLVQSQVLPYLRELKKGDYDGEELKVSILTFEPDTSIDAGPIRKSLNAEGIEWHWLPYHKRFSVVATAWDIFRGTLLIRSLISRDRPDVLHGRVHVPTLMGALARKFSRHKPKLLFDIRGFFPEEYTDAGLWPQDGWLYRSAKRVERWLMSEADGFVVLTENARGILFPESRESGYDSSGRPVEVIPCCVDLDRFELLDREERLATKESLGLAGRRVYVHVGSLSGLYLADKLADLLAAARASDPTLYALFLTQSSPDNIAPLLEAHGFGRDDFRVIKVPPTDVPRHLAASDVALSFVKAGYATASRSPTKIPEYLACGLPVIANRGVGDIDDLIERRGVGTLVEDFSNDAYNRAVAEVDTLVDTEERCRKTAIEEFDLPSVGGERYRRLYRRLLQGAFHRNSRDEDLHNQS